MWKSPYSSALCTVWNRIFESNESVDQLLNDSDCTFLIRTDIKWSPWGFGSRSCWLVLWMQVFLKFSDQSMRKESIKVIFWNRYWNHSMTPWLSHYMTDDTQYSPRPEPYKFPENAKRHSDVSLSQWGQWTHWMTMFCTPYCHIPWFTPLGAK